MLKTIVIALGGNALIKRGERGEYRKYIENLYKGCRDIIKIILDGHRVVITHGNGPQIGDIFLQQEMLRERIPPMPLDVCGAMSQGMIGYMIQQVLENLLLERDIDKRVVIIFTRTLVDLDDKAFKNPTKPIGFYYSERQAIKLMEKRGWHMRKDMNGMWRRVVPSPDPIHIVEIDAIKTLVKKNFIVIAVGGGGIPVVRKNNKIIGVEAVIDKDLASQILATSINADEMLILTNVQYVYLNYGKRDQRALRRISLRKIEKYYEEGQFPPGSMGPKILASIRFIKSGGKRVIISSIDKAYKAFKGETGTEIYPG